MDDASRAKEEYEIQLYGFPISDLRQARQYIFVRVFWNHNKSS